MLFQVCLAGGAIVAGLLYRVPELLERTARDGAAQASSADVPMHEEVTSELPESQEGVSIMERQPLLLDGTAQRNNPNILRECSSNILCASALKKPHQQRTKRVHWQRSLGNSQEQLITSME
jgi:hypothetical protein